MIKFYYLRKPRYINPIKMKRTSSVRLLNAAINNAQAAPVPKGFSGISSCQCVEQKASRTSMDTVYSRVRLDLTVTLSVMNQVLINKPIILQITTPFKSFYSLLLHLSNFLLVTFLFPYIMNILNRKYDRIHQLLISE